MSPIEPRGGTLRPSALRAAPDGYGPQCVLVGVLLTIDRGGYATVSCLDVAPAGPLLPPGAEPPAPPDPMVT